MQATVMACYWKDHCGYGQAFPSVAAAIEFLRRGSDTQDFVADKITLGDGTLLMTREELERLHLLSAPHGGVRDDRPGQAGERAATRST
jgi:hypothetical protein